MSPQTHNVRVSQFELLASPASVVSKYPVSEKAKQTVLEGRAAIRRILSGEDSRLLVIIGPCSVHDPKAALDYAARLAKLRDEVSEHFLLVMRVYFEKPRTTVGWKGFINDPHLDGSHKIATGLTMARELLLKINELGVPCATEFLDPIVPQYTADLVSWAAIGARTTESQTHRQMASGLSMPVGFKNATDGGLDVAINAMISAQSSHAFVGIDMEGRTAIVNTTGNQNLHLILRGGGGRPNYSRADVAFTKVRLEETFPEATHKRSIMIDCSHANSNKDHRRQPTVFSYVLDQVAAGESSILGMMVESFLEEGKQSLAPDNLQYGQSITDACISWETTEALFHNALEVLGQS